MNGGGLPVRVRCWVVVGADGSAAPWQEQGRPHHGSMAEAAGEISDQLHGDLDDPALDCRPVLCARPCTVLACADCGQQLADDEHGFTVHFDDGHRVDLAGYGWTHIDGRPSCGCQADRPGRRQETDSTPRPHDVPLPLEGLPAPARPDGPDGGRQ